MDILIVILPFIFKLKIVIAVTVAQNDSTPKIVRKWDLNFSAPKRNALLHIKSETISTFYTERDISLYHFHKLRRSICDNIK